MNTTPHAKRRDNCTLIVALIFVAAIVFGCTKSKDKNWQEVPPADKSIKDSVDRLQGWGNDDEN